MVDSRPGPFGKAVEHITQRGDSLNINPLGEEVLGLAEADKHLDEVDRILARGAERARAMAAPVLDRAREAMGFLPAARP